MANYRFKNGRYERQASDGTWFEVTKNKDGLFTWTQPNGKKVVDKKKVTFKADPNSKKSGPKPKTTSGAGHTPSAPSNEFVNDVLKDISITYDKYARGFSRKWNTIVVPAYYRTKHKVGNFFDDLLGNNSRNYSSNPNSQSNSQGDSQDNSNKKLKPHQYVQKWSQDTVTVPDVLTPENWKGNLIDLTGYNFKIENRGNQNNGNYQEKYLLMSEPLVQKKSKYIPFSVPYTQTASWFKNPKNKYVGDEEYVDEDWNRDNKVSVSNLTYFAGIDNGKLKIDSLPNFEDNQLLMPALNKASDVVSDEIEEGKKYLIVDDRGKVMFVPTTRGDFEMYAHNADSVKRFLKTAVNPKKITMDNGAYDHFVRIDNPEKNGWTTYHNGGYGANSVARGDGQVLVGYKKRGGRLIPKCQDGSELHPFPLSEIEVYPSKVKPEPFIPFNYIPKGTPNYRGMVIHNGKPVKAIDYRTGLPTRECAMFANSILTDDPNYEEGWGHAWTRSMLDEYLINGYDHLGAKPDTYNLNKILKRNNDAADYVLNNIPMGDLNKNQIYKAHMYYTNSKKHQQAYDEGENGITSTHTGNMFYNHNTDQWEVVHNIDGNVYLNNLTDILGGNNKLGFGITAISLAQKTPKPVKPVKSASTKINKKNNKNKRK